ncbi:hypothetical protein, conserved [Eimeria maxima]|uniref:CRAL-TRIO domain-containing protein n=1 Tax=Eimeria maxima TaxID=5804 RepID=U6M4L6_EIMMA|nr:hypothetical protein, conserved [Eimeria maxima]CDJ56605.1 hypothetical protein, conserved [Eimeria maxima]
MKGLKERPVATHVVRGCWILVFLHIVSCAAASSSSTSLDRQGEAALLTRVELKHDTFPTYVYGKSKSGAPVIYKPKLSGLRDFRKLFVLQTDSYMIDLLLQETNMNSFTLVLDFSALSRRLRVPTLEMWDSLRTVVDPLPSAVKASIEQMVTRVFERCEAVVVVNATTFLKLLKPVISLMVPVSNEKLFVSTDLSALFKVVPATQVPRPYNPSAVDDVSSNAQTSKLYQLLNARAQELLGRPLAVDIVGEGSISKDEMGPESPAKLYAVPEAEAPAAAADDAATADDAAAAKGASTTTEQEEADEDEDDLFDDID